MLVIEKPPPKNGVGTTFESPEENKCNDCLWHEVGTCENKNPKNPKTCACCGEKL